MGVFPDRKGTLRCPWGFAAALPALWVEQQSISCDTKVSEVRVGHHAVHLSRAGQTQGKRSHRLCSHSTQGKALRPGKEDKSSSHMWNDLWYCRSCLECRVEWRANVDELYLRESRDPTLQVDTLGYSWAHLLQLILDLPFEEFCLPLCLS